MTQWYELKEEEDILRLTDEDLKFRIIKLNDSQLSNIKYMSYYYLINRTVELVNLVENENILDQVDHPRERRILLESFHIIINSFKKFHSIMEDKEIEEELNTIEASREKLYNLKSALKVYGIEISYLKELVDHHSMKKVVNTEYGDLNVNRLNIDLLINRIRTTLEDTKDYNSFASIVSNILAILPFRMSKQKYFEVVKSTLLRNFKGLPLSVTKAQIEEYKELFDSRLGGDYGILYDKYFVQIERFRNMKLEWKTKDQLEKISKDIIKLTEEINKWRLFIDNLGIILNRLIILYLTKNGFSKKDNIRDIFDKWKGYYEKRDENLLNDLIEICNRKTERLEMELLERASSLERLNKLLIEKQELVDEAFNSKILFITKILNYYNDFKFTRKELLSAGSFEIAEKNYLIQLIYNLIQYMNRSMSTMNNLERKIRMRRFLSLLQLPFENIDEFFSYIHYSLNGKVTSKEEILFSIDMINFILEEYLSNTIDSR